MNEYIYEKSDKKSLNEYIEKMKKKSPMWQISYRESAMVDAYNSAIKIIKKSESGEDAINTISHIIHSTTSD